MIDPDKERENFISIRQLVELVAEATGKTKGKAAEAVAVNWTRNPAWEHLSIVEFTPTFDSGITREKKEQKIKEILTEWRLLSIYTAGGTSIFRRSALVDCVGFWRSDIMPILAKDGIGADVAASNVAPAAYKETAPPLPDVAAMQQQIHEPQNRELQTELDQARARIAELEGEGEGEGEGERAVLQRELSAIKTAEGADKINSPTLELILELVKDFPAWRAQQKPPPY